MMPEITLDRPNQVEYSARRLVAVLSKGWLVVASIAIVAALGAYAYAEWQPVVYKASGRIFLNGNAADRQDPVRLVNTQAQLTISTPVLVEISRRMSLPVEVVQQQLTVIPDEKGDYFTIAGTGTNPAEAARLVIAAQRAYQQVVISQGKQDREALLNNFVEERADLEQSYAEARAQAARAPTDIRLQARVDILAEQLKALRQRVGDSAAIPPAGSPVQLVESPQVPTAPAAPKPLWIGVAGGLLGAIIGVALVWWRSERVAVGAAEEPSRRRTRVTADPQPKFPAEVDEAGGGPNLTGSPRRERRRATRAGQRGGAAMAATTEPDEPRSGPTTPRLIPAAPWGSTGRSGNGSGSTELPPEPQTYKAWRASNQFPSTPARSPEADEAQGHGEAGEGTAGPPILTPELIVAFDRLTGSLQEAMETLHIGNRSVAERSLPQMEAERAAQEFGLDVVVILLDDGRGGLQVAGNVGLTPIEKRKAIRFDPDLWRAILNAGPRVMDEEDRARLAKAGIPGSVAETVLIVPLVHDDVGFGLLLASARADGVGTAAFDGFKIESMAAYARVIKPVLWAWVLAGRLKLRVSEER